MYCNTHVSTSLLAEIQHILYFNPDNGFVIASANTPDSNHPIKILGRIGQLYSGFRGEFTGIWKKDKTYGYQFWASNVE